MILVLASRGEKTREEQKNKSWLVFALAHGAKDGKRKAMEEKKNCWLSSFSENKIYYLTRGPMHVRENQLGGSALFVE